MSPIGLTVTVVGHRLERDVPGQAAMDLAGAGAR
jgi:hypothetical protein